MPHVKSSQWKNFDDEARRTQRSVEVNNAAGTVGAGYRTTMMYMKLVRCRKRWIGAPIFARRVLMMNHGERRIIDNLESLIDWGLERKSVFSPGHYPSGSKNHRRTRNASSS